MGPVPPPADEPVPPGRSGASDDRRLLLDAVTALASRQACRGLGVRRLCAWAGTSVRAFHDQFADIEDCRTSAVERALEELWAAVELRVAEAGPEWPDRVGAAIVGFLDALGADRARAWMALVEPSNGSPRVHDARQAIVDRFLALLESGPGADREGREQATAGAAAGAVRGFWEMARQHVAGDDRAIGVDAIAGSATFLALRPYLGRTVAMEHAFTAGKARRGT
jgi:AcrR family transcriptional regulator